MNASQLQERIDHVREINPALAGRYERGAAIYKANHIMIDQGDRVIVPSESQPGRCYAVMIEPSSNIAYCGCKDAQYNAPEVKGEKLCKHAVAAHLFLKNGPFEEN